MSKINELSNLISGRDYNLFANDLVLFEDHLKSVISKSRVLIIGGAGSIGSSTVKILCNYKPKHICVVDTNENNLTELTRLVRNSKNNKLDFLTLPISFGSEHMHKYLLDADPYDFVLNFAALKHVISEKNVVSILQMLQTNTLDVLKCIKWISEKNNSFTFFNVSTDKAANPVNVMGASKKLMEEVIMAYSSEIQITTARFANVAFSNGSLLAGYVERLFKNQPISCPSDVKRFFVSPEESGQICMLACMLGKSGEIFFPKLEEEEQVYFKAITEDFFKVSNRKITLCNSEEEARNLAYKLMENDSYPVYFFGSDTSGEKLYEEFYTDIDEVDLNQFESLGVIKNARKLTLNQIENCIFDLKNLMHSGDYDKQLIVDSLKKYIPDFQHIETGKSLDQKM
jgi:FlaA1/EpsC-like NDP-sugar epimerase